MPLTGPQTFFHAVNGYKQELSAVKEGICRMCGGELIGSAELFSKHNWANWNNEHMVKNRSSEHICLACIESRSYRKYQNKAKKGFIASLSRGYEPFTDLTEATDILKNLPKPPFVLAYIVKFTNIPVFPYLISNTNSDKIHILAYFGTSREMLARADNKKGYKVIKPMAQEAFDLFVSPDELIKKVEFCKNHKEEISKTLSFREACIADPEWATAAWLAGYKNNEIYRYVYQKRYKEEVL